MSDDNIKIPNPLDVSYEDLHDEGDVFNAINGSEDLYNNEQSLEDNSSKKNNLDKDNQLEQLERKIAETDDKYTRLYADFENLKRRSAKEKMDLMFSANEKILKKILPILDDFDRAMSASLESERNSSLYTGVKLIHNKITLLVEQSNVKMMTVNIADNFDPNLHEAITSIPHDDISMKGKVVEIVEKGYYLNETVLRFAKVIIAS